MGCFSSSSIYKKSNFILIPVIWLSLLSTQIPRLWEVRLNGAAWEKALVKLRKYLWLLFDWLLNEQRRRCHPVDCRADPLLHQWFLFYYTGLIAADENDDDNTLYTALSIAYEYLTNATKRKITWSLSLEKLAVHLSSCSMSSSNLPSKPTCTQLSRIFSSPTGLSLKDSTRSLSSVFCSTTEIKNSRLFLKKKSHRKTWIWSGVSRTSKQKSPLLKSSWKAWTHKKRRERLISEAN